MISKQIVRSSSSSIVDPSAYIAALQILPIPSQDWMQSHIASCKAHISASISYLKTQMENVARKVPEYGVSSEKLVVKKSELETLVNSYRGRGIDTHRKMLFLHVHLNDLKIKQYSYLLDDTMLLIEACNHMINSLESVGNFVIHYYSVDVEGYQQAVRRHARQIEHLTSRIGFLEKYVKIPPLSGPPSDLAGILLFPTSSTAALFRRISRESRTLSFAVVMTELQKLTDDPAEFDLLVDLAFDAGWQEEGYPFFSEIPPALPSFLDVRVALFDPPLLGERFLRMHIRELGQSDWPFAKVIPLLDDINFMHNPMVIAKTFSRAMDLAGKCAPPDPDVEMGFDAIFPILLICVLASGLTRDPRIFVYVGKLARLHPYDNLVQLGATYAEAIVMHIRELDESAMIAKTRELDLQEARSG
jgi:hypothetical protein